MHRFQNLWPAAIIGAFALFISGTISLIVLASSQREDLVCANYYEQEIGYQQHIDSREHARQLGGRARVVFDPAAKQLCVLLPSEQLRDGVVGRVQLYRPAAASMDRQFNLLPGPDGAQTIQLPDLLPGLWKVRVAWTSSGRDYSLDLKITNSPVRVERIFAR